MEQNTPKPQASSPCISKFTLIRSMYVLGYQSTTEIGKILDTPPRTIRYILKCMGVELRTRTVRRICKIPDCGKECLKKAISNGRRMVLSGSMCEEHTKDYWKRRSLARRAKAVYSKSQEHQQGEPKPTNGHVGA